MASPVRSARSGARPVRRQPAAEQATRRPQALRVIPGRRRVAWFAVVLTVLVSIVMMGAVYLHTRIAERQLEIDRLERSVRQAQEEFDILRAERAVLRSPTRLADDAAALGMIPGEEGVFVPVDPMVLAVAIARSGQLPAGDEIVPGSTARLEPLDQFRLVKEVGSELP